MARTGKLASKLNDLDAQILKILLKDGRTGYDELAEKCEVTTNVAWKRCKAMEKKGVIKGATVQINYSHFGFEAVATLLMSVNLQQVEQFIERINDMTDVHAHREYNSVYNVRAVAVLKNLNELDYIKRVIRQGLPTTGLKTYFLTGVRNIPENLSLNGNLIDVNDYSRLDLVKVIDRPKTEISVDSLDKQIVEKLASDGRASFRKIAEQIGVSTDTVAKRYNNLRDKRSINVSIQIDPAMIGYSSLLDFNIAIAGYLSHEVIESLTKIPDMIVIMRTSGDYDLQGTAMIRNISEIFTIQDQIAKIKGVTQFETSASKLPDRWPTPRQHISTF